MQNKFGFTATLFYLLMLLFGSYAATAQERWAWPEKLENMKVLPSDWDGKRLAPVMRGFARSLGVRCSHCHVGEEGQPLSSYDFVSDANPNKNRAREMLRMLGTINEHLDKIEPSGKRVNMWCHTCHQGKSRPLTLSEELTRVLEQSGADSAMVHYQKLKERYYGRGAFDFGEDALNDFGYELLKIKDTASAIAVFEQNSQAFPESFNAWDSLAEAHLEAGNNDKAIEFYRKSLQLNPDNQNARDMLGKLGAKE